MIDCDVEASLSFARDAIAGIGETPLHAPTPCTDWTLRQLLSHLIHTTSALGRLVAGEHIDPAALAPHATAAEGFGDDPQAAFAASAATALGAFAAPDVRDRAVPMPGQQVPAPVVMNLCALEAVVHGWDVARTAERAAAIPDALATPTLAFAKSLLDANGRRASVFGPEVSVPPAADASGRLLGLLGRQP